MLGIQSIWTLNSSVFVEKMCKIRVKYVYFIKFIKIGLWCTRIVLFTYLVWKGHIYVMLSRSRVGMNQFSTPNDQEFVNIHYLSKMTKIAKIDL